MKWLAWPLCLILVSPLYAQQNWPGLSDPRLNAVFHDLGHAAAAGAIVGSTGLVTDWPLRTRMVLGTVAWPIAAETYDFLRWEREWNRIPWNDKMQDFISYQVVWAYWFAKRDRWWSAVYTVLIYGTYLYWRHYYDPTTPFRDSYWFHGAAVGGYMAGMALLNISPLPTYIQANVLLGFREVLQLSTGQGEWTDLLSGLLLPLPYVLEDKLR